jgi:hypothetical protein
MSASAQITTTDEPVTVTAASPAPEAVRTAMRAASRSREHASRSREHERVPVARPVKATEPPLRLRPLRLRPLWTTARLNVWSGPGEDSRLLTVLDTRGSVRATQSVRGRWAQIAWKDREAWVRKAYLATTKPSAPTYQKPGTTAPVAGTSDAPCPDGSAVETGLQPNAVKLYRAVCAAFPAVKAWGGRSGSGGNHGAGRALDIMCSGSLGDAIASYARAHASELGVSEVIWAQHIWTVQRSSEGRRPMEDRGSATANHYDHVHVSLY